MYNNSEKLGCKENNNNCDLSIKCHLGPAGYNAVASSIVLKFRWELVNLNKRIASILT